MLLILCSCRTPPAPVEVAPAPPATGTGVAPAPAVDEKEPSAGRAPARKEVHAPLVDFEFLLGWTAGDQDGRPLAFDRTGDGPLWGHFAGALYVADTAAVTRAVIRPPKPVGIPGRMDAVNLWIRAGEVDDADSAVSTQVTLRIRDANEQLHLLPLGVAPGGAWVLLHQRVLHPASGAIPHPCALETIELSAPGGALPARTYRLDSLSAVTEQFPPLRIGERPRRNLSLPGGHPLGLHAGTSVLPFPDRGSTIIPNADDTSARPEVERLESGGVRFRLHFGEAELTYTWAPGPPGTGVSLAWNGREVGRVFQGAAIEVAGDTDWAIDAMRREDARWRIDYANGVVCEFFVRGKSLVLECRSRGGLARGMAGGRFAGGAVHHPFHLPGLTEPGRGPATVGWIEGKPPLFMSTVHDWYRSNASSCESVGGADPMVRVEYEADSEGRHHDLYERWVVTVSPRVEDVLPEIANPASPYRDRLGGLMWISTDPAASPSSLVDLAAAFARIGVTNGVAGVGPSCWRDGVAGCALRDQASETWGGDAGLTQALGAFGSAGWLAGLFTNYLHIHPLNPRWHEDLLLRAPTLSWRPGLATHFRVKPAQALFLQQRIAPGIRDRFGPGIGYLAGMTSEPPWAMTDFDARIKGAATFHQAYYTIGELLLAERRIQGGPVIGSGGAAIFYAGLADGFVLSEGDTWRAEPVLPLFSQLRLTPRAALFGAGSYPDHGSADERLDEYLAVQIAHGAQGCLPLAIRDPRRRARAYHLMDRLQRRYAGRSPTRIAYHDGDQYLGASDAIVERAIDAGRLYLQFADDLEIWLNLSPRYPWDVRIGGDLYELPPYGWYAGGPDFMAASYRVDGHRLDQVRDDGFRYLDGRGHGGERFGIGAEVPVWIEIEAGEGDETWLVHHPFAGGEIRLTIPGRLAAYAMDVEQWGEEADPSTGAQALTPGVNPLCLSLEGSPRYSRIRFRPPPPEGL